MNFAAKMALWKWLLLCVVSVIFGLILYGWNAEYVAWVRLKNVDVPIWAIVASIALAWVRNGVFWGWIFLASIGGWTFWDYARKSN